VKINLGELAVTSTAFGHGERMPDDQSGNGAGVSPELSWSGAPEGTESFALICHDPDAPLAHGFTHWVVYGIPASVTGIPQGGGAEYVQGANTMGQAGFAPAGPPPNHGDHFYYFQLYAIGSGVDLAPGLSADELLDAIDEHILVQARLVGTYSNS
jgi:Raf kinase inhibitor-like YbhB/YbcL family protein